MEIRISGIFNNTKVEVVGSSGQEVAKELKAVLDELGVPMAQLKLENIVPMPTNLDSNKLPEQDIAIFDGLVKFNNEEPIVLTPVHKVIEQETSRRAKQMQAFLVVSFALTRKGATEQTSNMISALMSKSGFDVERIDTAVTGLVNSGRVSKAKMGKAFTLTPKGEADATDILKKAKERLGAAE